MAKSKINVREIVEARLQKVDGSLDLMTPGSEGYSKCVNDLCSLVREVTEIEKAKTDAEDKEAKRVEQKRMNDKELEFKQTQIEIEALRATNEKAFKTQQLKQDLAKILVDSALTGFAQVGYFGMTRRVMKTEYRLTDGSSVLPPNGVRKALDDLKPKKKF